RGDIEQIPPMYSAVKQEGKPLYQLARKGVAVEREPRNVIIYELELLSHETPDLTLHVRCSSGTYIRSLAHDLGQELGCGAYLAGLRRTVVGHFELRHALPLNALTAETLTDHVQAMDSAVLHLPRLLVRRQEAESLSQGQRILVGEGHPQQELVRAYDETGRFVGIVTREQSQWRPRKIFYEDPSSASRC
ncbi:MAG TPA: tRNA pseudouridine(55) synthase TruB, partial [Candidatus Binatia bacterium]|nr:tRNA pseudouridine(55) synthase TruB [Candidatus Binatia bacterium]